MFYGEEKEEFFCRFSHLILLSFSPNFSTTAGIAVISSATSVPMEELLSLLMRTRHKFEFVIAAWYIYMSLALLVHECIF